MTMTDDLLHMMNLELALKEVDDMLSTIKQDSDVVSTSRVRDALLDIRNLLVPILRASAN